MPFYFQYYNVVLANCCQKLPQKNHISYAHFPPAPGTGIIQLRHVEVVRRINYR